MSKEFDLYEKNELTFRTRLFHLMDLLVSNKFNSNSECYFLLFLSYSQIIAGFFSNDIKIFTTNGEGPDYIFTNFQNILRVKDLLFNTYNIFEFIIYGLLAIVIIQIFVFFFAIKYSNKFTNYSFREKLLNYSFKYFHYLLLTPILDLSFSTICFSEFNPNFKDKICSIKDNPFVSIFAIFIFLYTIFLSVFLSIFYNDSFFLSNSCLARTNCNYELYHNINLITYSILLSLTKYIGKEVFMIYNLFFSIFSTRYYLNNYPYFYNTMNFMTGCFQFMYTWTSIFTLYLSIFEVSQRSYIYFLGSVIVIWMFKNFRSKFEEIIILDTPFNKITNKSHILFYINAILKKIQSMEQNDEEKAEMIGVIKMHVSECPLNDCPAKKKEKIYLPLIEEWTNRKTLEVNDKIYLTNFITFIFNFYISQNYMTPDLYMNLAIYNLQVIGNNFLTAYYYNKVQNFKLNNQEDFSFFRLHKLIQKNFVDKLKPTNEPCNFLEDLNTTMYFKYEEIGQKFFDEITLDCNSNLEFWGIFKGFKEKNDTLDFDKIFYLTDKIRISKNKIEKYWEQLFNIFNGYNDIFDLYENYIGYINDDGILCRELDLTKNKILISSENLQSNFTSILFSKDTGILIANGDIGKEGLIEHVNEQLESIFNFKSEELKGTNINKLMPKIFSKIHHKFMEKYNKVGEKKIINKVFTTYGKDRNNNLLPLKLHTKSFPILSDYILYISLIVKENLDDLILLDNKFNIQGMSSRLMEKLNINEHLFSDNDIPFYIICENFIDLFKNTQIKKENKEKFLINILSEGSQKEHNEYNNKSDTNNFYNFNFKKEEDNETEKKLEVNENAELEFEIKIPPFLQNYISLSSHRNINNYENEKNSEEILNTIREDEKENSLNEENSLNYYSNTNRSSNSKNALLSIPSGRNKKFASLSNLITSPKGKFEINYNVNMNTKKFEDEDIQVKINYYKNLFEKKSFENLDKEIKKLNSYNNQDEFKFIISIQNYKYASDNLNGYVVRCIEKEFDDVLSNNKNFNKQIEKNKNVPANKFLLNIFLKKSQNYSIHDYLKKINEYTYGDINVHKLNQGFILKKYFENLKENDTINESRIYMLKNSKLYNNNEFLQINEDIASSQSSSTQDEYSKKSRIMEIRSNLTKDIDKFFTFQAIKFTFLLMVLFVFIFSFVFILNFNKIQNDIIEINDFSNLLLRSAINFSELLSNLISLNSLYFLFVENENKFTSIGTEIKFNTFIDNKKIYFDYLKNDSLIKFNNLTEYFSSIENFMEIYVEQNNEIYWSKIENTHLYLNNYYSEVNLKENNYVQYSNSSMGIFLLEILSNVNNILKCGIYTLDNFPLNYSSGNNTINSLRKLKYSNYMAIQGGYFIALPEILLINSKINFFLIAKNKENLETIVILFLVFSSIFILQGLLFIVFLFLTNSNIQQSLEKVSLIQLEKIDEIINKINDFKGCVLEKFIKTDYINKSNKINKQNSLPNKNLEIQQKNNDNLLKEKIIENKFFLGESAKIKNLQVLNSSYYMAFIIVGILVAILIPVFFQCRKMINNSNEILDYKTYIVKDLLSINLDILNLKCKISSCEKSDFFERKNQKNFINEYVYRENEDNFISLNEKMNLIQKKFPEIFNFYKEKYLLDICETISDINYINFQLNEIKEKEKILENCKNDELIKSTNQTNALVKFISEAIYNIDNDIFLLQKDEKFVEFDNYNFKEIEYFYYNYLNKVYPNLENSIENSLLNMIASDEYFIFSLIILLTIFIFVFAIYIYFIYIKKLIHFLSISRCVLRIIPTNMIFDTPKLEAWVESKF